MKSNVNGSKSIFSKHLAALSVLTLLSSGSYAPHTYAAADVCSDIFASQSTATTADVLQLAKSAASKEVRNELKEIYEANNKKLADRYPKFAFVFKDPEAFVAEMRARFELQKRITPDDPRLFEFPEAADSMKFIGEDLASFREQLIADLQTEKKTLSNKLSHLLTGKRADKVADLTKALSYVKKLQADIQTMTDSGSYPYLKTIYVTYSYSRVRGYFQFSELNTYYQITKHIDMVMHGYRKKSMDEELEMYKHSSSPLLQIRSGKIAKEFRIAEVPFENAFERKDYLEYVLVPSVYPLGASAFMHVLPHKIHMVGASNTPVQADGFNRPGGLFWMHDVRHEADRYMKTAAYVKVQKTNEAQMDQFKMYAHKWHNEVIALKNSIKDPDLKKAVDHYHFYTHHDVGVPLIPSMFLNHHADGLSVYYAFLFHKKNAKQGPGFENWVQNTREAQKILTDFWNARLPVEKEILGHDPVKIKDWESLFPESK